MNNIITLDNDKLDKIDESRALQIKNVFDPMTKILLTFEKDYNNIIEQSKKEDINDELITNSKRLRLDIAKIRISTEKERKILKDDLVKEGKAIDGVANILKWAISKKEDNLKEIENHYIIKEKLRLEKLHNERFLELTKYVNEENITTDNLSSMAQDVWESYINTKKKEFESIKQAEEQAEKLRLEKAENERIENERIRKENAILQKEKDILEQAEKKRVKEEKEKQALIDAKLQAEKQELERQKEIELSKGDNEKLKDLIIDIESICSKYKFESDKNKKMFSNLSEYLKLGTEKLKRSIK